MYPTLSYLFKDLFGISFPGFPTFGMIFAFSFVLAFITTKSEMRRQWQMGLLPTYKVKITKGKKASGQDYALSSLLGFVMGYKLLYFISDWSAFSASPQHAIVSLQGSLLGGIIGAGISAYLTFREDKKNRLPEPVTVEEDMPAWMLMDTIVTVAAITGIIGAKVFHQLENFDEFMMDPVGSLFSASGLTFYGGLICGAAGVLYYTGKKGISWKHMVDATAPGLMLSYGVGRVGCQLAGDGDWGIVNLEPKPGFLSFLPDWAWAYDYPHNVVGMGQVMPDCVGEYCNALPAPVYPTPLYEAFVCILLFFFLWGIRKRIQTPGLLFSIYLVVNGFERFWIEKIRTNSVYHIAGMEITQAEIISSGLFLAGVWGIYYFYFRRQKQSAAQ